MSNKLIELLKRAETWPEDIQEEAVASLEAIEAELSGSVALSPEDIRALHHSAADVRDGRLAEPDEVESVFRRFRHP